ncbi:MAG: lipoate--protein ligase family protein [Thermoprotei archaeon]|nr:MAG: lipoate--protein ligase family protein [Thermoprotei archaeon]
MHVSHSLAYEAVKKARKGLIRVKIVVDERSRRIADVRITGDFFMYPEDALWKLEDELRGAALDASEVTAKVRRALEGVRLVGSTPEDFTEAVLAALRGAGVRE